MPVRSITQVINKYRDQLLALKGVRGIGQGGTPDSPHITLYIESSSSDILTSLPTTLENYSVIPQTTGNISAI